MPPSPLSQVLMLDRVIPARKERLASPFLILIRAYSYTYAGIGGRKEGWEGGGGGSGVVAGRGVVIIP